MSSDQIPSLPGKKKRQMPGVCPGGMLKLRFDWYIIASNPDIRVCAKNSGIVRG